RTHCIPDQPTALRHDARKLGRARLTSDDSEGHTIELVELDCRGRQWTLPYNLGADDAEDRLYEIKLATAFVMVTYACTSRRDPRNERGRPERGLRSAHPRVFEVFAAAPAASPRWPRSVRLITVGRCSPLM